MKFLASLGIKQAVLPPHERPHLPSLRALGFTGSDTEIVASVFKASPEILLASSSAAAMWTANAATTCPSADSSDGRVHFTPANLISKYHRSIEPATTAKVLKAIFNDPALFMHHPPLTASSYFADEGAANHSRFCKNYGEKGSNSLSSDAMPSNPIRQRRSAIRPVKHTKPRKRSPACMALTREASSSPSSIPRPLMPALFIMMSCR